MVEIDVEQDAEIGTLSGCVGGGDFVSMCVCVRENNNVGECVCVILCILLVSASFLLNL